ncbi:ABC transporter substrate-binding protein [Tenacibaculum holothuriorum]|uniref:ABC transporter substrate-binding protein n=2 Tax=Tenacibaculum holothuriorum TaxID=1635173 RepID=A0A1Y2PIP4_9FLAO|nr:ABC transporter substrate-binding protein [Tenacibaculum holothuriorum]
MLNKLVKIVFFFTLLSITSCKKEQKESTFSIDKKTKKIEYADGFDIDENKIIIKSPYPKAEETFTYSFGKKNSDLKNNISKLVVTSTTHIPALELLNKEHLLVGFPHTKYISSEKTRARIDSGFIKELGKEHSLNTEILLDLNPDLVVSFSMGKMNKTLTTIQQAGIPIILNGDWLEETPLGRAEWIKLFGAILNEQQKADSIFNSIKKNYEEAVKIAQKATTKPTILSGAIMSKDIWNLPAGESFVAQYLKDANLDYLWKNSKGKGSLSLSFESVLDKGKDADFWISPGYFSSKKQLLESNKHYAEFKAFKNDNIYTPNLKKGKTGGVLYFELAPTRPDLVLKDIIKITHPELLPNYKLTFFEKMK